MRLLLCLLLCLTLSMAGPALAVDLTTLAEQAAQALVPAGAEAHFQPSKLAAVDARVCRGQLDQRLLSPRLGPRVEVRFQCRGSSGWAANISMYWHVYQSVLVTTRPLARLDAINADTAHLERKDLTELGYGYISDVAILGQRYLARPLAEGVVLTPAMLMHQELVKTGDDVMLQAEFGGLRVSAAGLAMSGGDQGERVRVKNRSSGKVLEAIVTGRGMVEVMP